MKRAGYAFILGFIARLLYVYFSMYKLNYNLIDCMMWGAVGVMTDTFICYVSIIPHSEIKNLIKNLGIKYLWGTGNSLVMSFESTVKTIPLSFNGEKKELTLSDIDNFKVDGYKITKKEFMNFLLIGYQYQQNTSLGGYSRRTMINKYGMNPKIYYGCLKILKKSNQELINKFGIRIILGSGERETIKLLIEPKKAFDYIAAINLDDYEWIQELIR